MLYKKTPFLFLLSMIIFQTLMPKVVLSTKAEDSTKSTPSQTLASDALLLLKEGNNTYATKTFPDRLAIYEKNNPTPSTQKPHSIILSCSDSRVPPTLIFDQGLGETFSVRDAGEVPGISVIGSIEYAIEQLGVPLLVVMGHTDCGAIKAALSASKDHPADSPSLQAVISEIQANLGNKTLKPASPHFKEEAFLNAKEVAKNLINRSDIIKKASEEGRLIIVPALYDLQTGRVEFGEIVS